MGDVRRLRDARSRSRPTTEPVSPPLGFRNTTPDCESPWHQAPSALGYPARDVGSLVGCQIIPADVTHAKAYITPGSDTR
jgi:hypothetical protein